MIENFMHWELWMPIYLTVVCTPAWKKVFNSGNFIAWLWWVNMLRKLVIQSDRQFAICHVTLKQFLERRPNPETKRLYNGHMTIT